MANGKNFVIREINKSITKALKEMQTIDAFEIDGEEDCGCEETNTDIVKSQLLSILVSAKNIYDMVSVSSAPTEDWVMSKISRAEENLKSACHYLGSGQTIDIVGKVTLESVQSDALDANKSDDEFFASKKTKK